MKLPLPSRLALLATTLLTAFVTNNAVKASSFDQQAVDQSEFIAIARPYGGNKYDLLIIQQIPGQRQCWRESGSNPAIVEPLLLNFDFTGSCERSTDSNGYSIRIDGQDYGLDYLLRIVERNGELFLVGTHRTDPSGPEIVIGRTYGISQGLMKIYLNPGWQFTKRSYQGRVLSHVYLTGDSQAITTLPSVNTTTNNPPPTQTFPAVEQSSNSTSNTTEYTFTAPEPNPPVNNAFTQSTNSPPSSDFEPITNLPEDNFAKTNDYLPPSNFSPSLPPESGELPPPPTLNPISPPNVDSNSQVVPPPSLNSDAQRKTLADVLGTLNNSNLPTNTSSPVAQNSLSGTYKVFVEARNSSQQQQVRSLYPDAFPTSYNGRSLWQVGVFSSQDTAETVSQSLRNIGLTPTVIPF